VAASDPPTLPVLRHLWDWQDRAGEMRTWPTTLGEAYRQQWRIILREVLKT